MKKDGTDSEVFTYCVLCFQGMASEVSLGRGENKPLLHALPGKSHIEVRVSSELLYRCSKFNVHCIKLLHSPFLKGKNCL